MAIKSEGLRAKSEEQSAISEWHRIKSIRLYAFCSTLFALCFMFIFWAGCASLQHKEGVLAVVNGEPVTEGDLGYSLTIAHRREDLSSAGALDLPEFVQKLIDDRLIIQEARRMGMQDYPEVRKAIQAYVLRESVVRLHDEEIVKKVTITDDEIKNYYKKNYEQFFLGIIETDSEEKAQLVLEQLKEGADFKELEQKYSTRPPQKGGAEVVLRRNSLAPSIEKAVSELKPGEFSDAVKIQNKYYVIKLINREGAPDEGLEKVRGNIERALRKQKEQERSDEYLKYLRERIPVQVNNEIFSSINLPEPNEMEKLSQDERIVVQVNDFALTVRDFVSLMKSYPKKSKEAVLNDWIEQKLVDREALDRHYEKQKDFKEMVDRYEDQILKNTFINRVIVPQVVLSDEELKSYYLTHQESFRKPTLLKIQQITVKTEDSAQDILNSIRNGADFAWLAKNRSVDSVASEGGNLGWITREGLPQPIKKVVDTLKPGDISPIVKIDSNYRIIELLDKKEGEVEEFEKVKKAIYMAAFEERVNAILSDYIARLKKDADITINDEAIRLLEEKVQK
jgi:peptidyl-prolyl cis-trans isomerase C